MGLPPRDNNRPAETAAPAPRLPEYREVTIPAGTALPLAMTSTISSESAQVEAPVSAKLRNAITIDGDTAIPAGAVLKGTVTDVERSGRVQGRAHVSFVFNEVSLNSGREDLRTNPLTFEAEATKGEDATKVGVGAVGGAIIGGILGGKKGAGKGAVAGGAAGTGVVLATRGKEVTVTEGTDVTATLAQPMTVRVRIRLRRTGCGRPVPTHSFLGRRPGPTAASAAWNPTFECVPSQNGLVVDAPHRHNAIGSRSNLYSFPSQSSTFTSSPSTR